MSAHPLFPSTRPALAPILFPDTVNALEAECAGAIELAEYSAKQTGHRYRLSAMQIDRAARLSARIAQVAK